MYDAMNASNYYYPYYYYGNRYHYYPNLIPSDIRNPYQKLNPTLFNQSAIAMQMLLSDASIVLKKLATSKSFALDVMSAAQESKTEEVDRLIKSTGIKSIVETSYNPDGINLKLSSKVGVTDCCKLIIGLRWG